MPRPYSPDQVEWLLSSIDSLRTPGTRLDEIAAAILPEWRKLTGRDINSAAGLEVLYHKFKRRKAAIAAPSAAPSAPAEAAHLVEYKPRALAPGMVVVAVDPTGAVTEHQTLREALELANGNAAQFRFYEARRLRVAYKSILTVE